MKIGRDFIFDPSLVLYLPLYKLDGASIKSQDAYGHLCAVTGALWRLNGRYFITDDYIEIGDTATFKFLHGGEDVSGFKFTIELWMNLPTPEPDAVYGLLSTGTRASPDVGVDVDYEDRSEYGFSRRIRLEISGGAWVVNYQSPNDIYPNDSGWHLVSLTYDQSPASGNVSLYIDSILKDTGNKGAGDPNSADSTNALHIGSSGNEANFANVNVGEVRIYRRVLTPLEIQNNYLSTKWRYR